MPTHERVANVARRASTAARNHGHIDSVRYCRSQLEVVTGTRAIAVDTRDKKLAGTAPNALACPLHCIQRGRRPTTSRVDEPTVAVAPRIDAHDDALRAESSGTLRQNLRRLDCGRIDADFVGTGAQGVRNVTGRANP